MKLRLILAILLLAPAFLNAQDGRVRCNAQDEWGRYACVRVVGWVVGPDGHPTPRHAFILIRARHVEALPDVLPVFERADSTGHFDFLLLKYTVDSTAPAGTLRVPLTATWLDESRQQPPGKPQPVLGTDSLDVPIVFAPYGAVAPVDTVVFRLKRPPAGQQRE